MRGRPGCPTGQKKHSVGATGGSPPLFYKERLGTGSPPHPTRLRRPTFPPRGRLWAVLPFPSTKPPPPARPAGGRAVTGVGQMGRRPGRIKKDHLPSSKNQREVGPGRREPLSALVFFPPAFFQRKPGSRPESGGKPRRRAHPAPVQKAPKRGSRPESGGKPRGRSGPATVQAWTTCRYRDPQDKKEEPQWKSNNSS